VSGVVGAVVVLVICSPDPLLSGVCSQSWARGLGASSGAWSRVVWSSGPRAWCPGPCGGPSWGCCGGMGGVSRSGGRRRRAGPHPGAVVGCGVGLLGSGAGALVVVMLPVVGAWWSARPRGRGLLGVGVQSGAGASVGAWGRGFERARQGTGAVGVAWAGGRASHPADVGRGSGGGGQAVGRGNRPVGDRGEGRRPVASPPAP